MPKKLFLFLASALVFLPVSSLLAHHVLKDLVATDIQALGPDVIEAAEYAKRMSREEIEEVIDHILENVRSLSVSRKTYP